MPKLSSTYKDTTLSRSSPWSLVYMATGERLPFQAPNLHTGTPSLRMLADTRLRLLALQFRMAITVYNDKKQHKMTLQMWYSIQY